MIFIGSVKILGRWKIKVFEGARGAGGFSFGGRAVGVWGWSAQAAGWVRFSPHRPRFALLPPPRGRAVIAIGPAVDGRPPALHHGVDCRELFLNR